MSRHDKKPLDTGKPVADDGNDNASTQPEISTGLPVYEQVNYVDTSKPVWNYSLLTDEDVSNYQAGTNYRLYEKFGSHSIQVNEQWGMYFCVWAPNATSLSVIGNFNHWKAGQFELYPRWDKSGIWEGFIPGFKLGESYKYHIVGYAGR